MKIREGATYVYISDCPPNCKGHRYKVLRFVKDVPSYQEKVLVEPLDGPDKGQWFVVSLANFALRYEDVEAIGDVFHDSVEEAMSKNATAKLEQAMLSVGVKQGRSLGDEEQPDSAGAERPDHAQPVGGEGSVPSQDQGHMDRQDAGT